MSAKRKISSHDDHNNNNRSAELDPTVDRVVKRTKPCPKAEVVIEDEFQQVTKESFVEQYRLEGLRYGGDVFYQSDVSFLRVFLLLSIY